MRNIPKVVIVAAASALMVAGAAAWAGASTRASHVRPAAATASPIWAGYVATGQTFNVVRGSWTEPSLTCSSTDTSSIIEVGLDDYTSSSVEEAGSVVQCISGTPFYTLWYRTDPGSGFGVDVIHGGDRLTATVSYKAGTFTYALKDITEPGESFSRTSPCGTVSCPRSSAEWVVETGDFAASVPPLTQFASVGFSSSGAGDAAGHRGAINDSAWTAAQLAMVDASDVTMAASGPLVSSGTGFKVGWKSGT